MPEKTPEAIWSECLSEARTVLPPSTFDAWLTDSAFDSQEGDAFTVRFSNMFKARWAKDHYGELLQGALRDAAGRPELTLVCTGPPAPPPEAARPHASQTAPAYGDVRMTYLHPSYTFERFVAGPSNELAYAGARAVAMDPGKHSHNPFFIYGGVGLGKTHLIQAIAHEIRRADPGKVFWYVSSEQFTQLVVSMIRNGSTMDFRRQYRDVDILLMDDVQFLAGKETTVNEFFHRFNELYQRGSQIVLTSDHAPAEIEGLEERLISRFQSGLVVDIRPPEYETRLAILELKARESEGFIPPEVLQYIATSIRSNVRQLEGAVHRLTATSRLKRLPIDLELARSVLADTLGASVRAPSLGQIAAAVAESFGISPAQLRGQHRRREILVPRQAAMLLMRELTNTPLSEIGDFFSGRDHSTVLNSIERIGKLSADDPALKRRIAEIRSKFTS